MIKNEQIEADDDFLNFEDDFEADTILFSELDEATQAELQSLADFGYVQLNLPE